MRRPIGVTIIGIVAVLGGVSILLGPRVYYYRGIGRIGEPWTFGLGAFYVVVGIGLLAQSRWARLAAIISAVVSIGFAAVALFSGLQQIHPIYLVAYLFRLPLNGSVVWYLLQPQIRQVFFQPRENTLTIKN